MQIKNFIQLTSRKTRIKCLGVIVLAFASSYLASLWPVRLASIYTDISKGSVTTLAMAFGLLGSFALIYIGAECLSIVRRVWLDCIIADHEAEIREVTVEKLLKMPVAWYSGQLSGERTAELNQGVAGFSSLIKIVCNDIFSTILIAACTLYQVVRNAPLVMAGLMVLYLALTILLSWLQIRSQNGIRENIIKQKNALDGQICQSISNLELIRSMNAGRYEKKRLRPSILKIAHTEKRHHEYMGMYDSMKQSCKVLFQVLILALSLYMIANHTMQAASVITVCLLFQQLIKPIDEIYRFMDETASSVIKARTLQEVAAAPSDPIFQIPNRLAAAHPKQEAHPTADAIPCFQEVEESTNPLPGASTAHMPPTIVMNHVLISDPEKKKRLAYYDHLEIPTDTITAVKGESGCGKTTMMRGLNRYYPVLSGNIEVLGVPHTKMSQQELTQRIFYLPQKPYFFAGSIEGNLQYGLETPASKEEMIQALKQAALYDILQDKAAAKHDGSTPLDVAIGEGGSGLSGGEGQRLSLARAFLRTPDLFIFDESTANLDALTADQVLTSMESYAQSIHAGIVYISHDPHVVARCHHVIELENKVGTLADGHAMGTMDGQGSAHSDPRSETCPDQVPGCTDPFPTLDAI